MFSNAKKLTTTKPKTATDKLEFEIAGIRDASAVSLVIKTLQGLEKTLVADCKSAALALSLKMGFASKTRPDNFKGIDGDAFASCQLNKRSTSSALTDDEKAELAAAGISMTVIPAVEDTYVINPAYKDDSALLAKVEKKLKGIAGLPEDFILKQDGVSRTVVGDKAVEEVFALSGKDGFDADRLERLIEIVTVSVFKPNFGSDNTAEAYAIVEQMLGLRAAAPVVVAEVEVPMPATKTRKKAAA